MQTVDAKGQRLGPLQFIEWYHAARTLAPARFLTLRIHPDRFGDLFTLADIPESIQLGQTPGRPGQVPVWRVICVKPPMSVSDGIAIRKDEAMDPTKLEFQIHGVIELVVVNINAS